MALSVGEDEGMVVGVDDGDAEGVSVGATDGSVDIVGVEDGTVVGWKLMEGESVGERVGGVSSRSAGDGTSS